MELRGRDFYYCGNRRIKMETMQEEEQTQDTECMQQIRQELHHAKRKLKGSDEALIEVLGDYNELLEAHIKLEVTLERTSLKSKRRLKSIRGLEQALRKERLRHGYIKMEDMTYDERDVMLVDIATHKAKFERQQRESDASRVGADIAKVHGAMATAHFNAQQEPDSE